MASFHVVFGKAAVVRPGALFDVVPLVCLLEQQLAHVDVVLQDDPDAAHVPFGVPESRQPSELGQPFGDSLEAHAPDIELEYEPYRICL